MREVIYTDKRGYKHRALIRDDDPDSTALQGMRRDPPDIRNLDWEAVKKELHNGLVDLGIFTWADYQRQQQHLTGLVLGGLRRRILDLYKLVETEENDNG